MPNVLKHVLNNCFIRVCANIIIKNALSATNLSASEWGAITDSMKGQTWNFRQGGRAAPIQDGAAALPLQDGAPPDGRWQAQMNDAKLGEASFLIFIMEVCFVNACLRSWLICVLDLVLYIEEFVLIYVIDCHLRRIGTHLGKSLVSWRQGRRRRTRRMTH